jgi:hypothetical protein
MLIAQYAPHTPRTTATIAVKLTKKATKSAFTITALGQPPRETRAAANDLLYPHLTPAIVNN